MSAKLPEGAVPRVLLLVNLSLLVLFPLSWAAPLMRAGLLPLFGLSEISILSGLASLWDGGEALLAILVALFALVAPMAKTMLLAMVQLRLGDVRLLPLLQVMGKLAMADIFLIALYITLARGLSIGRLETAWGLWMFTACVLVSLAISMTEQHLAKRRTGG